MATWNLRAIRIIALLSPAILPAAPSLCADCVTWEEIRSSPDARSHHAMAYDSHRGVTVLHGGGRFDGAEQEPAFDDTWEWDGERWTLRATGGPGPRAGHALSFDPRRGVTVLFGGYAGEDRARDTWEWDGTQWTRADTDGPAGLCDVQLAYDQRLGLTILYGQYDDGDVWPSQMWGWDGQCWTMLDDNPPAIHYPYRMVYDDRRSVIVLVGNAGWPYQTWEWDGSTWSLRNASGLPIDDYGDDFALAYDGRRGVTVAHFGPYSSPSTCEWDGSSWTAYPDAGLAGRSNHALAYDSGRGVTVLFGGRARSDVAKVHPVDDTWEWDGVAWTQRHIGQLRPPSWGFAVSYDREREVILLWSIYTWKWNGGGWTRVTQDGPLTVRSTTMVFDEARAVTVLFGNAFEDYQHSNRWSETWEWNGSVWTNRAVGGPQARYGLAMTFDTERDVTVLFGGSLNQYEYLDDLWTWDGSSWRLVSTGGPPPRAGHAMAYDRARGRVVLFGGVGIDGSLLGDTWEWDGQEWTLRSLTGPSPRQAHALAYDEERGVMVLFGGLDSPWPYLADTWEWDGDRWSRRAANGPSARQGHALVYSVAAHGVVLFGGDTFSADAGSLWVLDGHELAPDFDDDCDVDLLDLAAFQACFGTDQSLGDCERFDADSTGDITLADFEAFHRKLSGPSPPD